MIKRISGTTAVFAVLLAQSALAQTSSPLQTADQQADGSSGATTTTDPNAAVIAQANAQKTVADAQAAVATARKLAADAEKAATEAQVAAAGAKNGTVAGSTYATGAVTVGDGGPQSEAMLLVARALRQAASDASVELAPELAKVSKRTVLLVTDASQVSTMQLTMFDVQTGRLIDGLSVAHQNFVAVNAYRPPTPKAAAKAAADTARFAPLAIAAGADTALSVVSKLGSFFMTDYKYGTVAVTASEQMYGAALLSGLRRSGLGATFVSPADILPDGSNLLTRLQELDKGIQTALDDASQSTLMAVRLTKQAETDTDHAAELHVAAARFTASAAASQAMIDATNGLVTSYFTASADKAAPIAQLLHQDSVKTQIGNKAVVLLVTGTPTAAYYTKKNLWTFFGGMPVYTMGGTVMTYKLFEPKTGEVLAWGTIAKHGDYRSVTAVERLFTTREAAAR